MMPPSTVMVIRAKGVHRDDGYIEISGFEFTLVKGEWTRVFGKGDTSLRIIDTRAVVLEFEVVPADTKAQLDKKLLTEISVQD